LLRYRGGHVSEGRPGVRRNRADAPCAGPGGRCVPSRTWRPRTSATPS
jgi:hypothetical protein